MRHWALIVSMAASAAAQEPPPGPVRVGVMAGAPADVLFLGPHGAFEREVVKGAPFTAETETEILQTLADGNRLARKTTGRMARDGEGRVRREQTLAAIGGLVAGPEPPRIVVIHDPVAGHVTFVHEEERRATRFSSKPDGADPDEPARGHGFVTHRLGRAREAGLFHRRVPGPDVPEPQSQSLGADEIEGVRVEGERQTIVIPAGQIGNEKPLEIVSEQWRSPELDVTVRSSHHDPRFGQTEYRLRNIQRGEPDASLFGVPAGYTIEDGPPRFGIMKRGRRSR